MATSIFTPAEESKQIAEAAKRIVPIKLEGSMEDHLKSTVHPDFGQLVLNQGAIIEVPKMDQIEDRVFAETYGTVVLCPCKEGNAKSVKKVYLGAFGRDVVEYNPATKTPMLNADGTNKTVPAQATGAPAAKDVYKLCNGLATDWDILSKVAGKQLKVAEVKSVTVPRYSGGSITGTKTRKVPCFVLV